jgi:hypothetical protein
MTQGGIVDARLPDLGGGDGIVGGSGLGGITVEKADLPGFFAFA